MKRSLLIYSVWISLLLITFVSCRSSRMYTSDENAEMMRDALLSEAFDKILVKAKINYRDREMVGIMMIKKTDDENYKLAFYNELGMTYFEGAYDCSGKNQKLIVNNIAPAFNYKPFINNLEKCLRIVFNPAVVSERYYGSVIPDLVKSSLIIKLHNGFIMEFNLKR